MSQFVEMNKIFRELMELESDIKPKVKRIAEIKAWCKELGTMSTDEYVCCITMRQRTCLVGLDQVVNALGRTILDEMKLIQVVEYQVVNISEIIF